MAKKVWYYQWYKVSERGLVSVNPAWFPESDSPNGWWWNRDEKSKRRFKEIEEVLQ